MSFSPYEAVVTELFETAEDSEVRMACPAGDEIVLKAGSPCRWPWSEPLRQLLGHACSGFARVRLSGGLSRVAQPWAGDSHAVVLECGFRRFTWASRCRLGLKAAEAVGLCGAWGV
jgi:hypothetical protein